MQADYYFRMGMSHAICQDYAVAGLGTNGGYAIVSDGCSGVALRGDPGSPYTDFGARFLVRAAMRHLAEMTEGNLPAERIITEAAAMARQVGLPIKSLDATLLVAVEHNACVRIYQRGDGVIATRDRAGKIRYSTLKYGGNMPYYLSYDLDPSRRRKYFEDAKTVQITERVFTPSEGWSEPVVRDGALGSSTVEMDRTYADADCDLALIMSDGAESFQRKDGSAVPLEEVLEQLFAIKGFAGEFLVRRCSSFLQRFCAQAGWSHHDDFSVAGLYLGAKP